MSDDGAGVRPGQGEAPVPVPVRPRGAFVAHEVFGHGAGAVLVEPEVARDLRTAAEFASQERRVTGGLLYGRHWTDDDGRYLVVDGFLEAESAQSRDDQIAADGGDSFALSDTDLRLLREDAARMYPAAIEVGWWRSLPEAGEFGPRDFETQRELVAPGDAGLLVFGSGLEWGTAYLGPGGDVPGSARSFIPVPRPAGPPPAGPQPLAGPVPDEAAPEKPGPGSDLEPAAGAPTSPTSLATRHPSLAPVPPPAGPRVPSHSRAPAREWGGAKAASLSVESGMPADVKIVVGALIVSAVVAAVMIGALLHNPIAGVIAGLVLLLGLSGFLWMSRL